MELGLAKDRGQDRGEGSSAQLPAVTVFFKIDKAGYSKCSLCSKEINYSNKGSHALSAHCQTEVHRQKVCTVMTTASVLPVSSQSAPKAGPEAMRARVRVPVPTCQRVANAEVTKLWLLWNWTTNCCL